MDKNEPKECIKIKQPIEVVSFNIKKKTKFIFYYMSMFICLETFKRKYNIYCDFKSIKYFFE